MFILGNPTHDCTLHKSGFGTLDPEIDCGPRQVILTLGQCGSVPEVRTDQRPNACDCMSTKPDHRAAGTCRLDSGTDKDR